MSEAPLLPLHGFVLAGGKSSRMGRDKALLSFQGQTMVEIAVTKLRGFCAAVSLSGNRDDLRSIAPVVHEERRNTGPAAGIEAGLRASTAAWALFVPVDVPLVPAALLRAWAEAVLRREQEGVRLSFLQANGVRQPTFCMLHRDCLPGVTAAVDRDERKLGALYQEAIAALGSGALWIADAEAFSPGCSTRELNVETMFSNVNTPADLSSVERRVAQHRSAE